MAQLRASRPTAVNLFIALDHLWMAISNLPSADEIKTVVLDHAKRMIEQDERSNLSIAQHGQSWILNQCGKQSVRVLTHCNTGYTFFLWIFN
jgi:methylthioribose-1-phosphate isomerase